MKKIHSKVSVIIPVYNMEMFLAETLESVLRSDYDNFEVIVMDDGSTDSSFTIAEQYASKDARVCLYRQANQGVSSARNNAIERAQGCYILPVDADDLIADNYISLAASALDGNPTIKVISREAEFFGDKTGRWKFKQFSLNLLCRKNFIDNCSMYRKKDWKSAGGYCSEILGDEDWDFWLSLFETGGDFLRLPIVGLYYRIRKNSRRVQSGQLHKDVIDALNARHKPLFYKELAGKLHYQRTHSKKINKLITIFRPHHVYSNAPTLDLIKLVYAANEIENPYLKADRESVQYIMFKERHFHFPGFKIKKSKARKAFNHSDKSHLGYFEEQVSSLSLRSFLVIKLPD